MSPPLRISRFAREETYLLRLSFAVLCGIALFPTQANAQGPIISTAAGGYNNNASASANACVPIIASAFNGSDTYVSSCARIYKADSQGRWTVVAGTGTVGYSGDGEPATSAQIRPSQGLFVDGSGNIFIADTNNQRIREVVNSTGIIRTVAGTGTAGYNGDSILATSAELNGPSGVSVDSSGNVFIADTGSNRIREIVAAMGTIQTVAGSSNTPGFGGDGQAATSTNVLLNSPHGVFEDGSGNIFIADTSNNRIREVSGVGIIETVAGNGTPGLGRDGSPATSAQLNSPVGVYVDGSGNIFITTTTLGIREVLAGTGKIQSFIWNGAFGYSGDGGLATNAQLNSPPGIAVDSSGNIFIADQENSVIREGGRSAIRLSSRSSFILRATQRKQGGSNKPCAECTTLWYAIRSRGALTPLLASSRGTSTLAVGHRLESPPGSAAAPTERPE